MSSVAANGDFVTRLTTDADVPRSSVAVALLKRDRLEVVDMNMTAVDAGTLKFTDAVGLQKVDDETIVVLDANGIHLVSLKDTPTKIDLAGKPLAADASNRFRPPANAFPSAASMRPATP